MATRHPQRQLAGQARPAGQARGPGRNRRGATRFALGLLLLVLQGADPPRYHPGLLDCARYRVTARAEVELQAGRRRSRETTGREGVMVLRAEARDTLVALVAWFDSLVVWREGSGERYQPDTDGLIGGRYHGLLTRQGGFAPTDGPFLPDEVAEVVDLGGALAELLPPLPGVALHPGQSWRDSLGAIFTRLPDGLAGGQRRERYRLIRRFRGEQTRMLPDSSSVLAERAETESGVYEWATELGMVRWDREVTNEVTIPAGGPVRQPFRTRIEQQVTTERTAGGCGSAL